MADRVIKYKPWLYDAALAHKKKLVRYDQKGCALIKIGRKIFKVSPERQYDLTQATIFGLNERLTMSANSPKIDKKGSSLRDKFNHEWERYSQKLLEAKGLRVDYGVYAYYFETNDLVKFCGEDWHRVVATASSSMLITDPQGHLSWKKIREKLAGTTIAVAGCSVGGSIIHAAIMDLRPKAIKLADKSMYKMENINRVRLGYWEMVQSNARRDNATQSLLRNKAEVTARQIYSMDPFINIYVYEEGINESNVDEFLEGAGVQPQANIIVEEVDDPRIKILLRSAAKKYRVPLLMLTDIGSCVQMDILRYDKNPNTPLAYGINDKALLNTMENFYRKGGDRTAFFHFVDKLIGKNYRQDELKKIIEQKTEIPTSTIIPQLGSTIAVAGGIAAEAVARITLGYEYPKRVIFNKKTFSVKKYN